MDEEEGIITSLFQPLNDMNIDEGEVPSPSQPPDGHGLPPEGNADHRGMNHFAHEFPFFMVVRRQDTRDRRIIHLPAHPTRGVGCSTRTTITS